MIVTKSEIGKRYSNIEFYNAEIKSVYLGEEDHGIMTSMIQLDYERGSQGFGGYNLTQADSLHEWITGIMSALEAREYGPKLIGKTVRVAFNRKNYMIEGIGHIIKDRFYIVTERWNNP